MNHVNHRCGVEDLRWLFSLESSTIKAQQAIKNYVQRATTQQH